MYNANIHSTHWSTYMNIEKYLPESLVTFDNQVGLTVMFFLEHYQAVFYGIVFVYLLFTVNWLLFSCMMKNRNIATALFLIGAIFQLFILRTVFYYKDWQANLNYAYFYIETQKDNEHPVAVKQVQELKNCLAEFDKTIANSKSNDEIHVRYLAFYSKHCHKDQK